jgi:hypothetical protein
MPKPRINVSITDAETIERLRKYEAELYQSYSKTVTLAIKGKLPALPSEARKK